MLEGGHKTTTSGMNVPAGKFITQKDSKNLANNRALCTSELHPTRTFSEVSLVNPAIISQTGVTNTIGKQTADLEQ